MPVEALVTFSKPDNDSGASERERIPPNASAMEGYGGHLVKHKNTTGKKHAHTATYYSVWCHPSVGKHGRYI